MAYVNGTTHYNLPQTVGTDKRDWADTNQAFADVDAALYGAVDDVAQAQTAISELQTRMSTAEENISDNTADIAGLDTRLTTAEGAITSQQSQITDLRQDTEDMICAFNEASATSTHKYEVDDYFIYNDVLYRATQTIEIDDTIVPDTNCTTTNVATELLDVKGDIPDVSGIQEQLDALNAFKPKKYINSDYASTIATRVNAIIAAAGVDPTKSFYVMMMGGSMYLLNTASVGGRIEFVHESGWSESGNYAYRMDTLGTDGNGNGYGTHVLSTLPGNTSGISNRAWDNSTATGTATSASDIIIIEYPHTVSA